MSRILINVQVYGDFEIPISRVIMEAPEGMGKKAVYVLFKNIKDKYGYTNEIDDTVRDLITEGFSVRKTLVMTIGGEL